LLEQVQLTLGEGRVADQCRDRAIGHVVTIAVDGAFGCTDVRDAGIDAVHVVCAVSAVRREARAAVALQPRFAIGGLLFASGSSRSSGARAASGASGAETYVAGTAHAAYRCALIRDAGVGALLVQRARLTVWQKASARVVDAVVDAIVRAVAGLTVFQLAHVVDAI